MGRYTASPLAARIYNDARVTQAGFGASFPRLACRRTLQRQVWQWVLVNRSDDGGAAKRTAIARAYGRRERWRRLVKNAGLVGVRRSGQKTVLASSRWI